MSTVKTMGTKRTTKATQEEVKMQEDVKKATTTKAKRQSTAKATQPAESGRQRGATKKRLRSDRPDRGFWYLNDTADLEGVTDEQSNPLLGITSINVFEPSEKQWDNGTVANISLDTIIGQIKGIQVIDSDRDNSIYIRLQSRTWTGQDGKPQRANDVSLDRKVEAQILRHVNSLLVDVE